MPACVVAGLQIALGPFYEPPDALLSSVCLWHYCSTQDERTPRIGRKATFSCQTAESCGRILLEVCSTHTQHRGRIRLGSPFCVLAPYRCCLSDPTPICPPNQVRGQIAVWVSVRLYMGGAGGYPERLSSFTWTRAARGRFRSVSGGSSPGQPLGRQSVR